MRKTKIVCTLGPASDSEEMISRLMDAGMNVCRLNMSHGSYEEQAARIARIKRLREEKNLPVAILLDTKGPEVRTKTVEDGKVTLEAGSEFILTSREIEGNAHEVSITYPKMVELVHPGTRVLIDDGLLAMEVVRIENGTDIVCSVTNGGVLGSRKGISVPDVDLQMPSIGEKDRSDIIFGIEQGIDLIAASFVCRPSDVLTIRKLCADNGGSHVQIFSKIENRMGVDNFDDILKVSDGIMVARGDLGVEVDMEEVPVLQKQFIHKCNVAAKPVITATQMLDSMIRNPRPTRAEASDVANAIIDGTDAIMLSGETAAGKYPVEAVRTMDAIALRTEANIECDMPVRKAKQTKLSITAATAHAACTTAMDIGADAILSVSQRGVTAQMVSRFRPSTTVVALLLDPQVQRQMALYWGVEPITMPFASSTDELVDFAVQAAEEAGIVKQGDLVVVTAGVPVGIAGTTNMIRVCQVGGALLNGVGIGTQKASGPLCVCRTLDEVAEKFRPGDVLVVPYTTNALLPYIRQAAAVISEEASTESHSATVGLTLDKPVIVAAPNATRRLTDGTVVSVDCARGVVQTMPQ